MRNSTGRSSIAEMNTYHKFVKQPKSHASTRASASAGPHQRAQIRNPAAPATTQGKKFVFGAKSPTKPSKRIVIMKSAKKGPAK